MREDVEEIGSLPLVSSEMEEVASKVSLSDQFKNSMRNLAAGVSVVTVGLGSEATGFTATSVVSLAVDTPTILVSLNRGSASWPLIQQSRRFAVNILSDAHVDVADTFAGRRGLRGSDRYIDPRWLRAEGKVPYLADALAVIECELEEALQRYSHAILIGRVVNIAGRSSRKPLLYWQGSYNNICQ